MTRARIIAMALLFAIIDLALGYASIRVWFWLLGSRTVTGYAIIATCALAGWHAASQIGWARDRLKASAGR